MQTIEYHEAILSVDSYFISLKALPSVLLLILNSKDSHLDVDCSRGNDNTHTHKTLD
uniref:Uncharacterized protein n=1 Tax=Hyaloperonospora arabidopsidis (strain Emoy2) TaxID=559515 RepID=M4BUM3_HYAAE